MESAVIRLGDEGDFEIGSLRVRPSACEIARPGGSARVEPRVMQVLVALSRRPGETVSRERLIAECWGGISVGDDAVVRSVSQLRKALGNGEAGVSVETVPKVGYRLVASFNGGSEAASRRRFPRRRLLVAVAAIAAALWAGSWVVDRPALAPAPSGNVRLSTPLTSLPGMEQWPSISPSGGQVAYSWRSEPGAPSRIYVKSIGGDSALALTHEGDDAHPAWSPDGGRLAFARSGESGCSLHTVSPFGGSEFRVATCGDGAVLSLDWSPSGETWIYTRRDSPTAPGRAYLLDLADGSETAVLVPAVATTSIEEVAFSPEGKRIAFTSSPALGVEDLYVHHLLDGTTERVTRDALKIHGFDWLPDGRGFVLSSNRGGEFALWRVGIDGSGWAPLPGAVGGADEPDVSASGRVVYEVWRSSAGIWRAGLPRLENPMPLVTSTRFEWDAERSPDAERLTFISDRSGSAEVWVSGDNGETLRRLTSFGGPYTHTPRFSPDGRRIAFATPAEGNFDLFLLDVESGSRERLTTEPADDFAPSWSPRGDALFFGSTRSGAWQIWRLDVETREARPVTANGGRVAQVSPDGGALYFVKADEEGLWRLKLASEGAVEEKVIEDLAPVDWNNWQVMADAVYYVRRPVPGRPELVRNDLPSGKSESLGELPALLYKSGLFVSPDESEVLFTCVGASEADILFLDVAALPRLGNDQPEGSGPGVETTDTLRRQKK